jgi:hypothetical protein
MSALEMKMLVGQAAHEHALSQAELLDHLTAIENIQQQTKIKGKWAGG